MATSFSDPVSQQPSVDRDLSQAFLASINQETSPTGYESIEENEPFPSSPELEALPGSGKLLGHFASIGASLSRLERNYLLVALPFFLASFSLDLSRDPSGARQTILDFFSRIFSLNNPLDEAIKEELVTVPTEAINAYLEDLEEMPLNSLELARLRIQSPKFSDRLAFVFVLNIFISSLFFAAALLGGLTGLKLIFPVIVFSWLNLLPAGFLASDIYRKFSFCRVLSSELARRTGQGPGLACPT